MTMFGYDLLISEGDYVLVDVNPFPSYKEVP